MVRKKLYILSLLAMTTLLSCHKKDLDEFNQMETMSLQQETSVPLFYSMLTLEDTLPYHVSSFFLADTFVFESIPLQKIPEQTIKELTYFEFKIITENNLPIKNTCQLYFLDANTNKVDSIFATTASPINLNGYTQSTTYIYMDYEKYTRISNCPYIMIVYSLYNSTVTTLLPYQIRCKVGLKAKWNSSLEL